MFAKKRKRVSLKGNTKSTPSPSPTLSLSLTSQSASSSSSRKDSFFAEDDQPTTTGGRGRGRGAKDEEVDSEDEQVRGPDLMEEEEEEGEGKKAGHTKPLATEAKEDEDEDEEDPFEGETPDEKRIRLAKEYLQQLDLLKSTEVDAAEVDRQIITERLKQDVLENKGKLHRRLTDKLSNKSIDLESIRKLRGHQLSITSLALTADDRTVFSASKDCTIVKWDIESGKKVHRFEGSRKPQKGNFGHIGEVLAISVSDDGKYLASGGADKLVRIWDAHNNKLVETFKGHRDMVTALTFRYGTHQLFSGSNDRTVKIWDVNEMMYVDTLYGHQSEITCLDSFKKERAVTGSRDKTVHVWKVLEETQLVFRGQLGSVDCVASLNEEMFISGADDGSIALWSTQKKKPLSIIRRAHTPDGTQLPNWITSVSACKNTDLVASGSSDGFIRLWKASTEHPLSSVLNIPTVGFVNAMTFSSTGQFLVAGIGQEHKLGRWSTIKEARNGIRIIPLPSN